MTVDVEADRARLWQLEQIAIRIRRREVARSLASTDDNGLGARTLPRIIEDPPDPLEDPELRNPWLEGDGEAYRTLLDRTIARRRDK